MEFPFGRKERTYKPGSIALSEPRIVERLTFLGLTPEDVGVVASWADECRKALPKVSERFYEAVTKSASTNGLLHKHTTVPKMRPNMERYLSSLFDGRIDDAWVSVRNHVGKRHDEIDLDCMFYFGGYEVLRDSFGRAVEAAGATKAELRRFNDSFARLLYADAALTLNALMASRAASILKETDQKDVIMRFVDAMGTTVTRVSERDLTARMNASLDGEFGKIATMFNGAIEGIATTMHQVIEAAAQVSTASTEVTIGSQSCAQAASEQSGTLQEISSSLEEISGASRTTVSNTTEGQKRVSAACTQANAGLESMHRLSEAIGRIKTSSDQTAKIVKTIDEIAFQTNLLALNAAVEAARAGDAGRGFAVVAEEVRNLAIRSAEAAKTTSGLIEGARQSAEAGVNAQIEVSSSLEGIHKGVRSVEELMEAIANASAAQARTVQSIAKSVDTLARVTQQTAAAAEESASAAEELSGQAVALDDTVNQFKLDNVSRRQGRAASGTRERVASRGVPPLARNVG